MRLLSVDVEILHTEAVRSPRALGDALAVPKDRVDDFLGSSPSRRLIVATENRFDSAKAALANSHR